MQRRRATGQNIETGEERIQNGTRNEIKSRYHVSTAFMTLNLRVPLELKGNAFLSTSIKLTHWQIYLILICYLRTFRSIFLNTLKVICLDNERKKLRLELQTINRRSFTITEKAPTRAFSCQHRFLKPPVSHDLCVTIPISSLYIMLLRSPFRIVLSV